MSLDQVNCTDDELANFLDKAITLRRFPTQEDVNATTNTGIVRHINFHALGLSVIIEPLKDQA